MANSNAPNRPLVSVAISPQSLADLKILQQALHNLAQEDPTIRVETAPADGHAIVSGMGELHLEIFCGRILREYSVLLSVGPPAVIYLETIRQKSEAEGKYIRIISGIGNFAHVKLRIEPQTRASDTSSSTKL